MGEALTWLGHYQGGINAAWQLISLAIGAGVLVRIRPLFAGVIDRAKLVAQLDAKDKRIKEHEIERDRLVKALEVAEATNSGWQSSHTEMNTRLTELNDRVSKLDHRLAVSTKYIVDLLLYIRNAKWDEKPPEVPAEIRDSISPHY